MAKKEDKLQARIDELLDELAVLEGDSPEYDRVSTQVSKLMATQTHNRSAGFSKDALLAAGVNIAGILIITQYEKADVITSKAFNLLFNRNR